MVIPRVKKSSKNKEQTHFLQLYQQTGRLRKSVLSFFGSPGLLATFSPGKSSKKISLKKNKPQGKGKKISTKEEQNFKIKAKSYRLRES